MKLKTISISWQSCHHTYTMPDYYPTLIPAGHNDIKNPHDYNAAADHLCTYAQIYGLMKDYAAIPKEFYDQMEKALLDTYEATYLASIVRGTIELLTLKDTKEKILEYVRLARFPAVLLKARIALSPDDSDAERKRLSEIYEDFYEKINNL